MKTLILFYSRTGTTKKVAEKIAASLQADIEEVFDTVKRSGVVGYILSGRDATQKKLTTLQPLVHNVLDYDLVIVGTPTWAWTMSTPIRTLLTEQKDKIKQVAFFCTQGGAGDQGAGKNMAQLLNKEPIATINLLTKEVMQDKFTEKLDNFVSKLKQ